MPRIQCADPLRDIGIAWDYSISHNGQFVEDMSSAIRLYQSLGIDVDSHPAVINMEKELGKNLLEVARNRLLLTLKAVGLPYELDLQYSDQGNKIEYGMKIASFSLGYCLVHAEDEYQDNKRVRIRNPLLWIGRPYAAAYVDTDNKRKIMHLYDYGNKQSRLLEEIRYEVSKYRDTIGSVQDLI